MRIEQVSTCDECIRASNAPQADELEAIRSSVLRQRERATADEVI
jgi:hypothetical protein